MTPTYLRFVAALWLVLLVAGGTAHADEVREAIVAVNQSFVGAFLGGDAKAVANLYTKDAQVIAPGSPMVSGRAAIADYWKQSMDAGVKELTLETLEVESDGDLACETGNVRIVDGDGNASTARYLVVWKRIHDAWFLHRDIWNAAE
jgi:uncharacterized protein (TIGR02246 family)